jgi:hypothetical protein
MREQDARNIVHTLAGLIWLLTATVTAMTFWTLWRWRFFSQEGIAIYRGTPVVAAVFNMLLVFVFGVAIGWGLWRKRNWARILALIFCALVALDIIIFIFANPLSWSLLFIIVLALIGIWALGINKDVKALFKT